MKKDRCGIIEGKKKHCKEPVYIMIKVTVFHPDTLRKSRQTWTFCEKHFKLFLESKGQGWFCQYSNYGKKRHQEDSPVIDYKII